MQGALQSVAKKDWGLLGGAFLVSALALVAVPIFKRSESRYLFQPKLCPVVLLCKLSRGNLPPTRLFGYHEDHCPFDLWNHFAVDDKVSVKE